MAPEITSEDLEELVDELDLLGSQQINTLLAVLRESEEGEGEGEYE